MKRECVGLQNMLATYTTYSTILFLCAFQKYLKSFGTFNETSVRGALGLLVDKADGRYSIL